MQVLLCLICVLELKELVHVKKSQYLLAGAANPSNAICSIMWPDCLNVSVIWGVFVPVHLKRTQMQTQRQAGRLHHKSELWWWAYILQNTKYKMQNAKCLQQKADEGNSRGKTKKYQTEDKAEATENRVGRRRTHEDRRNRRSKTRDADEPTKSKGEWCQ